VTLKLLQLDFRWIVDTLPQVPNNRLPSTERAQMSRLDAFSFKHSSAILRIKKSEIFYQNIYLSNPAVTSSMQAC
jgi:hypothetical protein